MGFSDILGALLQGGITPSSNTRIQTALENSSGTVQGTGPSADATKSNSGGIGDMFGNMLNQAGQAVGGNRNLAIGGLGALAGALMSGGRRSLGGAVGGGMMALLGVMAFRALQGKSLTKESIPPGPVAVQNPADQLRSEQDTELVLKAMINAAKSDGQIDDSEIKRINDALTKAGVNPQDQHYVFDLMKTPMETDRLIAAAKNRPDLAAQLYAASLMAIEVDTPAEEAYLNTLASGLGLTPEVTAQLRQMVGVTSS